MVVGLAAGLAVGVAGGFAAGRLKGGDKGAKSDGGSAATEAAALLMPGAGTMNTSEVRVSLESSSSLMSALLHQLWPQINKVGIKSVKDAVEPMLAEKLPKAFKGVHFKTLDLGNQPIKFENFVVHPVVDDTLRIELEINWDSSCNILLGGIPGGNTIGVKEMKLRSRLVVFCRPILDVSPIIAGAQIAFINHPYIDLDFTGLADVADWANVRPMVSLVPLDYSVPRYWVFPSVLHAHFYLLPG
jgi:Synaptotagmin-like mitochondrial-lipid-binding domain